MKKERILAIIGIVLPIICLFPILTTFDSVSGEFIPNILVSEAEPYPEALQNQIWVQTLIVICVMILFQIFYYSVFLIKGAKDKKKSLMIFSIIGLLLCIGLLLNGIRGTGAIFSFFIHVPFSIIFSIVMLVRSFKKS